MDNTIKAIYENLTEIQRTVADIVGIEAFISLMKYVNGDTIYIPQYPEVIINERNKQIIQKFNGYNFKELSIEFGITVRSIYNIIPPDLRKIKKRESKNIEGQISF